MDTFGGFSTDTGAGGRVVGGGGGSTATIPGNGAGRPLFSFSFTFKKRRKKSRAGSSQIFLAPKIEEEEAFAGKKIFLSCAKDFLLFVNLFS